jgi:hypothetical protein
VNDAYNGPAVVIDKPSRGSQLWLYGLGQSTARCLLATAALAGGADASSPHETAAVRATLTRTIAWIPDLYTRKCRLIGLSIRYWPCRQLTD